MSAEASDKTPVQLFVYDMSKGMAKSLSLMFLGKEIAGLWHTAIVVFGREYFFGGMGIQCCDPGITMLGEPDQRIDLGDTEVPFDLFMEYIYSLGASSYTPQSYELFTHNCNNFSNELANFLTGCEIPKHILDLPNDILNSPLGPVIRATFSNVQISPAGNAVSFANGPRNEVPDTGSSSSSSHAQVHPADDSSTETTVQKEVNRSPDS